jgi:hypothetical protein
MRQRSQQRRRWTASSIVPPHRQILSAAISRRSAEVRFGRTTACRDRRGPGEIANGVFGRSFVAIAGPGYTSTIAARLRPAGTTAFRERPPPPAPT